MYYLAKFLETNSLLQTFDIIDNVRLWKQIMRTESMMKSPSDDLSPPPVPWSSIYVLYSWLYKLMTHEKYLTYNLHINPRGPCFTILTQKVPLKLSFKDRVINFIQHHIGCQHRSWITPQKYVVVLPGVWLSSLLHSTGMFRSFWNG